eukprot:CAMPEP_0119043394 /NCGR_PEP_ID=MMETSP1177-20130426/21412_1 /TAXON_ID=2985 /ORGANISM="Ochromonas sp, Strain CCMP1899" /LENGTH=217 /DNA_ID=CAMNT_0007011367 /DNA_START=268 /DNA_END=921 /DNA_ORIENTATION=-
MAFSTEKRIKSQTFSLDASTIEGWPQVEQADYGYVYVTSLNKFGYYDDLCSENSDDGDSLNSGNEGSRHSKDRECIVTLKYSGMPFISDDYLTLLSDLRKPPSFNGGRFTEGDNDDDDDTDHSENEDATGHEKWPQVSERDNSSWPLIEREDWIYVYIKSLNTFGYYKDHGDGDSKDPTLPPAMCIFYLGAPFLSDGIEVLMSDLLKPPFKGRFSTF